jgi:F0F1-type ATP synthase assembly protein I
MWTFIAGMVVGSVIGILMVALVSANRDDKED